jgi:flagellar motor switch protein FliN
MESTAHELSDDPQQEIDGRNGEKNKDQYDIDLILDIPLDVSVELGKVKMLVNDLLQLGHGSIIELTKSISEPLDIYANNRLIAKGEVVVMEEKFGIRVADIINPIERIKHLG